MTNHSSRKSWHSVSYGVRENPGCYDTGNGALAYIEESAAYPGIERVTVRSYCGRTYDNHVYYRLVGDGSGAFLKSGCPSFKSAAAAMAAKRSNAYAEEDQW